MMNATPKTSAAIAIPISAANIVAPSFGGGLGASCYGDKIRADPPGVLWQE
jgi:hypothetical protein